MKVTLRLIAVLLLAGAAAPGWAQGYPNKPVRILVGYAPGGGTDIMARAIGAKLTDTLKQQFVIENRPGANANIAAKLAADAPADGYTILFMSVAHIMSKPVYKNLGYDIERDFVPITVVTNVPNVLCLHPSLPVKNVKELIALAKAKPGTLTYATSGVGSPEHFAGEMFKMMTGTDMLPIPYKGGGAAGGGSRRRPGHACVQYGAADHAAHPVGPRARDRGDHGQARRRLAQRADHRGIRRTGLPMSTWYGAVIQAKTPREIVVKLNQEMIKALALPDIKERMAGLGADVVGNTPEEAAALIKLEVAKYTKVANAAHISAD